MFVVLHVIVSISNKNSSGAGWRLQLRLNKNQSVQEHKVFQTESLGSQCPGRNSVGKNEEQIEECSFKLLMFCLVIIETIQET